MLARVAAAVNGRAGKYPEALNPRTFTLTPGQHTLHFLGRENRARLGPLIITDDPYFTPEGPEPVLPAAPMK